MTGRPGDRTMEMNGGSAASYLAHTPRVALFMLISTGLEAKGLLDFQYFSDGVVLIGDGCFL